MDLYDVSELGGRIAYDGAPGVPRSVLVYAFTSSEAAETVREIFAMSDDVGLVTVKVSAPRAHHEEEHQ